MRAILAVLMLASVFLSSSAAETRPLSLMPMPASVQIKTGQLGNRSFIHDRNHWAFRRATAAFGRNISG